MRTDLSAVERFRKLSQPFGSSKGDPFGLFIFPKGNWQLRAMVADGEETGWDHVSVSIVNAKNVSRMPDWDEMCWVKNLFFEPTECVVQFHPSDEDYVNMHPNCLHLWRCIEWFPTPPKICV